MLDLTAIKARRHNIDNGAWKPVDMLAWAVADIDALLAEVERQANEIKQLNKQVDEKQKRIRRLDLELREHDRVGNSVDMEFED